MNKNEENNIEAKVMVDKDNDLMFMECNSKDESNVFETLLGMLDVLQEEMEKVENPIPEIGKSNE